MYTRLIIYLFIAVAFLARSALFIFYYRTKHHRIDDLYFAIGLFLLALSFTMYAFESFTPMFDTIEIVLGILAVFTTVRAYLNAMKGT